MADIQQKNIFFFSKWPLYNTAIAGAQRCKGKINNFFVTPWFLIPRISPVRDADDDRAARNEGPSSSRCRKRDTVIIIMRPLDPSTYVVFLLQWGEKRPKQKKKVNSGWSVIAIYCCLNFFLITITKLFNGISVHDIRLWYTATVSWGEGGLYSFWVC